MKILILAQQGDIKHLRKILNGTYLNNYEKAKVFAILKKRDSMYYYMDKMWYNSKSDILQMNGSREFDPYRKEERYKAFLKENYFPLTHWNE